MIIISEVEKGSIAQEIGLSAGDEIISINSYTPKDIIEYSFCTKEEELEFHVKYKNGDEQIIEIEKDFDDDLGISFESAVFDRVKPCANKCIFCFVDQQPKGLRETLYIKDDDWRLSYLQGTYVTLTNLTQKDWQRIESFYPTPLYVSVHTTNPDLRAKMLRNPRAKNIMEDLLRLQKSDIKIHAQIVLCPGYNDGEELLRTLEDLKKVKKILKSLAVVPLGVSKYRKENLKMVDADVANFVIDALDKFNADMKKNIAMASDEFFVLANREIPDKKYYGKFAQIEDGVGAIRLLVDDFNKCKKKFKKSLKKPARLSLLTGATAAKYFKNFKKEINVEGLNFEIIDVKNRFFGEKINVTGLITGEDLICAIEENKVENALIPSIMLREGTEEFLDGVTVDEIRKKFPKMGVFIIKECYNFSGILEIINSF